MLLLFSSVHFWRYSTAKSRISAFSILGFCSRCVWEQWNEGGTKIFHHCKVMNPFNTCRGWMWFSFKWLTGSDVLFNSRLLSSARLWFIRSLRFFSTTGFSTWMEFKLWSLINVSQLSGQYFYTVKTISYIYLYICVYNSLYAVSSSVKSTWKSYMSKSKDIVLKHYSGKSESHPHEKLSR